MMVGLLLISVILIKLIFGSGHNIYLEEECDRIRRPIHELSTEELMLYAQGLQAIQKNGKYQVIVADHASHTMIHRGSSFFFWHSYLVWEVETQIRALGGKFKCFALPYYDWSVDAGFESSPSVLNTVFGGDGNAENNYCLDEEGLWSVEHWPIRDAVLCAETEDVENGCCLKRNLGPTIILPTATDIGEVVQRKAFIAFKGGIVYQHQKVHWLFAQCPECAMATGYSPDDPIFMMLHAFTAYLRGLWATCNGYNNISSDVLDFYPNVYTAACAPGYEGNCGTIELDEPYGFGFLSTREWSITSKIDITPRMLWDFTDWGVIYDIGTFYQKSLLHSSGSCPQDRLHSSDNKWFTSTTKQSLDSAEPSPVNIVFILMDDVGWSDVSFNGGLYPTPNIDNLFAESISLERHYSHLICSPSRSQFITGRYAHNMGFGKMLPWDYTEIGGIPLGQPTVANWLQSVGGWSTYALGKWHLGYAIDAFTPTHRGFDHFYGFYQGAIGYDTLKYKDIEFGDTSYYDFWEDGEECFIDSTNTNISFNTMDLFRDKIFEYIDVNINNQNIDPFYMYLALQTMHVPLIQINTYEQQCRDIIGNTGISYINMEQRIKYCTNLLYTDDIIGDIINKLKQDNDLWSNTLLIFSTDNGGDISKGGCNYPFRGTKGTLFDGNTRTIALVSGGVNVIEQNQKGTKRNSLFSSLDWTPTLLSFACILNKINDNYNKTWDGINQYEMIMYGDQYNKRDNIVLNVGLKSLLSASVVFMYPNNSNLYKYIAKDDLIDLWQYNNIDGWCDIDDDNNINIIYADNIPASQSVDNKYLFDLSNDISERNNLLFNINQSNEINIDQIINYAMFLFDGITDNKLYHEPMKFLWNRLPIGDPHQNGDENPSFIKPFLTETQYFNRIKTGFQMLNINSIELNSLYLNKWYPPNTINNDVTNAVNSYNNNNNHHDLHNLQFTYLLFFTLLFVIILIFIGCLWILRNMKKETIYDQYTLLLNENHDAVNYGTNHMT